MTMTKEEWIAACAAQYMKRAAVMPGVAEDLAEGTLEAAIDFEGSEEAALAADPVEYADGDMDCWGE